MPSIVLTAVLRCPACGYADTLAMPTDACLFFHACAGCGVLLRPFPGDCCVFCSYGSVACPPMQAPPRAAASCQQAREAACGATTLITVGVDAPLVAIVREVHP